MTLCSSLGPTIKDKMTLNGKSTADGTKFTHTEKVIPPCIQNVIPKLKPVAFEEKTKVCQ